ncbi:MAG: YtxH domain-containing protein [Sarcina sp.]
MKLSQLLEEKRKAKKRQAMAKTAKTVGITAVVGASVGAIGGVLFAPKSGKETRTDIKNSALDVNGKLKEKANELKGNLNTCISTSKDNLNTANTKIKDYLKNKKDTTKIDSPIEVKEISSVNETTDKTENKIEETI